ncbi:MAG: endonuclease/exonuclease/phosphatase family protein, partial [Patulibacter sp.]|nr:endonuclease/exonuclease/phosphatase family protein [Patulibacter sp.]
REPRRALLLGAGAAAAVPLVTPRVRRAPQPAVAGGRTVRVMSANVYKGRADAAAVVALVRLHRPDILALQEQNPRFLRELAEAGLFDLLPHRVVGDGGRLADGAIVSRHPLRPTAPELPSEYVAAIVDLPGGPVPFLCAHPLPPSSPRYEGPWIRSLAQLPAPEGWIAGGLVAGDFNATLDHPQFRSVLRGGWRDAGSELGGGLRPTWRGRAILRLTLDHVLAPPGAAILDYRVDAVAGSDHRAITATVELPPAEA